MFDDVHGVTNAIRAAFRSDQVSFYGGYVVPRDLLVSDRERTRMLAQEVWEITGFRFK